MRGKDGNEMKTKRQIVAEVTRTRREARLEWRHFRRALWSGNPLVQDWRAARRNDRSMLTSAAAMAWGIWRRAHS